MLHVAPRGERTGTRNASPRPPRANTRRWLASLLVGLGGLTASHTSYAESHLEVVIRETTRPPDEGRILIDVTFINTGDTPAFIPRPSTPFGRTDEGLNGNHFVITDAEGNELPYRGAGAGYWGQPRLSHFVVVAPGDSVHKEVDLNTGYEFTSAGEYTVRFGAALNVGRLDPQFAPREELETYRPSDQPSVESNTIVVRVPETSAMHGIRPSAGLDETCSAAQLALIDEARPVAKEKAQKAHAFMVLNVYPFSLQNGELVYRYESKRRFERWFGVPAPDAPVPGKPLWRTSDSGQVEASLVALHTRLMPDGVPPLNPKCGCPGYPPETPAHSEDHNLYLVHFCPAFFRLPLLDPVASRVGVLLHEMTHFYDGHPGTGDYDYGKQNVEDLAKTDRWKAVRNADNYEFFVLDTTPYEE